MLQQHCCRVLPRQAQDNQEKMTHIFLALRFWIYYADQPRGHRTVYFADPEGNQLEIWAEIGANDNARKRI